MSRCKLPRWIWLLPVALLLLPGCARERAKREAKQRVFAPPPPDPVEVRAAERIDTAALARDPLLQARVNRMSFAEVAGRLGHLRFEASQKLTMERGDSKARQKIDARIAQSDTGSFSADVEVENGDQQHLLFFGDTFYVRHNYGRWRASRDPTEERLRWREEAYRLWPAVYDLFREQLRVAEGQPITHQGRPALRFELSVQPTTQLPPPMPENLRGFSHDAGPVEEARQLAQRIEQWRRYAVTESGGGTLVVDAASGVPLEVSFSGVLRVEDEVDNPVRAQFEVQAAIREIGVDPKLGPPEDSISEFTRRKIVTKPLSFLDGGS